MSLNTQQYGDIARRLLGYVANARTVAHQLFQHNWTTNDTKMLEAACGIFECEQCCEWKEVADKDPVVSGTCLACVNYVEVPEESLEVIT